MLERGKNERGVIEIVSIEELVPQEHLLRKVEKAVEFGKLYEIVEPFYSDDDDPPKGTKRRDNASRKKLERRKKAEKSKKTMTVSTTDPDSGIFRKGDHKRCFAYEAHTACDAHGYVLETVVTPGNIHDSVADDVYDKVTEQFPEIETVWQNNLCKRCSTKNSIA